ncbi:Putative general secretion pathway protein A [Campylobacter jejuni]|nr:Putative general secretion pathway protein A [Campylobacter jejuni]
MYHRFFTLADTPFSISPDPACFYLSDPHSRALTHLSYGLGKGSVVVLTGEAGTGKTTLSHYLLQQSPTNIDVAWLSAPLPDGPQFYAMLCRAFMPEEPEDLVRPALERFHTFLAASYHRQCTALLIIDEAQHLSIKALELLRLLTNIENGGQRQLQLMLIGQPELQQLLQQPQSQQLDQRITARFHLKPLGRDEVDAYIRFRLQVAGRLQPLFTPQAVATIYRMSKGTPRIINQICERALLGAYGAGTQRVGAPLAAQAAYEVTGRQDNGGIRASLAFCLLCAGLYVAGWFGWQQWGVLPAPEVKMVRVSVALPPDAGQVRAFRHAVENARSQNLAISQLYRVWGYESPTETADCESAARANLRCYRFAGTLFDVLALNYPVVVQLDDEKVGNWYAVLSHIEDEKATLIIDNKEWQVSSAWLQRVWQKNATLFWPLPDSGTTLISRRSDTADVQWADKALSEALGVAVNDNSRRLKTRIEEKIKLFQQKTGLRADGMAGEQTLMRLSHLTANAIPRLNGTIPAQGIPGDEVPAEEIPAHETIRQDNAATQGEHS